MGRRAPGARAAHPNVPVCCSEGFAAMSKGYMWLASALETQMGSRLAVLALASMWWMGCSSSPPTTGPGGSGGAQMLDPERVQFCQNLCSGVVGDSPRTFCLKDCASVVLFTEFEGWVLAGAEATVKIRETYGFGVAFNDQQLLTRCDIHDDATGMEGIDSSLTSAFTNFSLAVPRESADYFSFTSVPDPGAADTVIWGLYDKSTGQEWSGDPGGQVKISCKKKLFALGLGLGLEDEEAMVCKIEWLGNATGNFGYQNFAVPSSVHIDCIFVPPDAGGLTSCDAVGGCDDMNPCTFDLCYLGFCRHGSEEFRDCEVCPPSDVPGCLPSGIPGVCSSQDECIPSPCGQFCDVLDLCFEGKCDQDQGVCVSYRSPYCDPE